MRATASATMTVVTNTKQLETYVYMCVHMCICMRIYIYICISMHVYIYICNQPEPVDWQDGDGILPMVSNVISMDQSVMWQSGGFQIFWHGKPIDGSQNRIDMYHCLTMLMVLNVNLCNSWYLLVNVDIRINLWLWGRATIIVDCVQNITIPIIKIWR
jgi:hypothetical protein